MYAAVVCLLVVYTATPAVSSKILYLHTVNATSHHMWNTFLATQLAERGHEVTFISPIDTREHPNMKFRLFQLSEEKILPSVKFLLTSFYGTPYETLRSLDDYVISDCATIFEETVYKDLVSSSSRNNYDLIIMEYIGHDCLLGLSYKFAGAPVILLNPITYNPHNLFRLMGAPVFHGAPHAIEKSKYSGFWKRLESLVFYFSTDFDYYTRVKPSMETSMKHAFGEDVWPLDKLRENIALAIINMPDWMNTIPLPANILPIGGVHLVEAKSLSLELKNFVEGAEHGIIVISFGTLITYNDLNIFQEIASAVGKLPQRIVWKWDSYLDDRNMTFSKNVLRLPWIPQNDLLGHPKTRLFVSHCGGQSVLEAAYHGIPILAVPGYWDQNENADRIVVHGAGQSLQYKDITEKLFLDTSNEVLNNPRYAEQAARLKIVMREQPVKPLDRAIFWIEFVIRNRGAPHLRPRLWSLPHPYILLADIVLIVISSVIFVGLALFILMRLLCGLKFVLKIATRYKRKIE